jgi:hypothetical protein
MTFYAAETHRAVSEGDARFIFQFLLTHGQYPQSRADIVASTCL